MAFYDSASGKSIWRGIDYYNKGKVKSLSKCDGGFQGIVEGSNDKAYNVTIDLDHPKRSTCDCPFAEGRYVICKHMIALYFTSVPSSYEAFEKDMRQQEIQYELEEERWRKETFAEIKSRVSKMTAKEAREILVNILYHDELDRHYRNDRWQ